MLSDYLRDAARARPGATAVRFRGRSITYSELERSSAALAGTLVQAGVGPGDRVAIWLNKSIEAIVAAHAILRAGAAYVPIDPVAPPARARHILKDCRVRGLVTAGERWGHIDQDLLAELRPAVAVLTDEAAGRGPRAGVRVIPWSDALRSAGAPAAAIRPDQLAYVLYTSGSTGAPRGVMLSHRNAEVFVDWARRRFRLGPEDRVSSHAPLHFDLSVLDVFGAASAAATLVLVPDNQQGLGLALVRLVAEERISVWYSVPAALVRMVQAANRDLLAGSLLRLVLFAGEVFPIKHLRALRAAVPGAELCNLYGPTETNVCTFHRVTDEDLAPTSTRPVPIGRPCDYATAFVVDDSGCVVETGEGVEGELCIAGDSVMLGYWGDPDLTEARTIVGPGPAPARRAYRTGDVVRCDERGSYVFVGRRDDMVKSRGYRIELGEVEAAILGLEEVQEAAAVAIPDAEIGVRLEACLVLRPGAEVPEAAARRHCLELLPRPMVPERFHVVEALPRTPTGKVDRRALMGRRTDGW